MAFQPEIDEFDAGVYQIEQTDPVLGGVGGVTNTPLLNLANRTKYLFNRIGEILGVAKVYAVAGGTANAITAAYTPAVAGVSDGQVFRVRSVAANTAGVTFTPNSGVVAVAPVWGRDHAPLTGGEFGVNGQNSLEWNSAINLPNGAYVLVENTGGIQRTVAPGPTDNSSAVPPTSWIRTWAASLFAPLASPAFTGSPQAPTPALSDNTTRVPNTAWSVARGVNSSGLLIASLTGNVGVGAAGGTVIANAVITMGLPPSASVPQGTRITFASVTAGAALVPAGGDSLYAQDTGPVASVTFGVGDSLTVELLGTVWFGIGGTLHGQPANDTRYAKLAGLATQPFSVGKGTAQTHSAALSQVQNGSRVMGLIAQNNAASPATQYDISCTSVTLREPSTGACYTVPSPAQLTVNTALAGPAANGRDGAGAIAPSQWVRLFYIYNPTTATLATIASVGSINLGPNLPAGYTAWAYIGSIYWTSGSAFVTGNMRGARFQYGTSIIALNGGTSTGLVAVPIPTLVPPECGWYELFFQQLTVTSGAGGSYSVNCAITTQAVSIFNIGLTGVSTASQPFTFSGPAKQVTNFGQSFAYALSGSGVGMTVTIYVTGYSMPNGGE